MDKVTKNCRLCGKSFETVAVYPLPVCESCAPEWDRQIEKMESESRRADDPADPRVTLERQGIRPAHYAATIDSFVCRTDDDRIAVQKCRRMVETRAGILVLIGGCGTGKTHLACAIIREIGGKIMKMIEVGMYIRKAFKDNAPYDEQEALQNLSRLPFLAIDEAEKSKGTANETAWLSYIIDERYARKLPTVIVANLHLMSSHKENQSCDRCFEKVMPPDVLDRIRQVGSLHYFSGDSYRPSLRVERK